MNTMIQFLRTRAGIFRRFVVFSWLISVGLAAPTVAQIRYPIVWITGGAAPLGVQAEVGITLDRMPDVPGVGFSSFELLIAYDSAAITLVDGLPGRQLTNCGWESFTYQEESLPDGRPGIRISAIADIDNGDTHPSCFLEGRIGEIVKLRFQVTTDSSYGCSSHPIQFYWGQCTDNLFVPVTTDSIFVAFSGCGVAPGCPTPPPPALPSVEGLPLSCAAGPIAGRIPSPSITFWSSQLELTSTCPPPLDRGDINLNGIAYETADAVYYINYLLEGDDALESDPLLRFRQIANSDVNADSIPLSYRDLFYLVKVLAGDFSPMPNSRATDTVTAVFTQDLGAKSVRVASPHSLAGGWLRFHGEIIPTFQTAVIGEWIQTASFVNGVTRVLILTEADSCLANDDIWFTYQGEGVLFDVETGDLHNTPIRNQLAFQGASASCGDINLVPQISISDVVYLIQYIFAAGPPPPDLTSVDVNCDSTTSVADAVYLVNYIFAGGLAPCANCP